MSDANSPVGRGTTDRVVHHADSDRETSFLVVREQDPPEIFLNGFGYRAGTGAEPATDPLGEILTKASFIDEVLGENECVIDDVTREILSRAINRYGLGDHSLQILDAARTAVRLRPEQGEVGDRFSRLGGAVALPLGQTWPSWKGRPLALIAQIELCELSCADLEDVLPTAGRLLFFYDPDQETWGFDPNDRGSWRVIYLRDDEETDVAKEGPPPVYSPVRLRSAPELSIPPWESLWFETSSIKASAEDAYMDLRETITAEGELIHKMLGYADPVQGEMQTECQLASNGIYCGSHEGHLDPRVDSLRAGASEWRLLLQVDSEEDRAGMMWGDAGRLYFWIKDSDLRELKFDETWLVLQCY